MNGNKMLFISGLLLVISAISPARTLIRLFALICFAFAIMTIMSQGRYKKVIPRSLFVSGLLFIFTRSIMGFIKGNGAIVLFVRDTIGEMLFLFLPIAILCAMLAWMEYAQFRRFVLTVIILCVPFLLLTIRADVGSSRMQMAVAEMISVDAMIETYEMSRSGVMMYSQIHSLPFLVVSSVMLVRHLNSKKEKIGAALFTALVLLALIRSGFGYAIALSLVLVVMSFVGSRHFPILIGTFLVLLVIGFFLIKTGVIVAALEMVQNGFGYSNVIGEKAGEIAAIIRGEETSDFETRKIMYGLSWDSFCENPFFGAHSWVGIGGHAYWLDMLGRWGFVGFFFEALMFGTACHFVCKWLPKLQVYYFLLIFVSFIFICSVKAKGFDTQNPVIFLMAVPMLLFRADDFYAASNNIRRMFRFPPRIWDDCKWRCW